MTLPHRPSARAPADLTTAKQTIDDRFDAVIIGAGPAGASAAILLARAGWSVALVEKQLYPRRKVCGECIAASNLPLLEALGIGPAFDALAGAELHTVALMCGEVSIEADLPAASHATYRWGRGLGRETLDTLLLAQARTAGATVLQPASVQSLTGGPGDWQCSVRGLEPGVARLLRSPVVIAAHGSWEALPAARPARRRARRPSSLFAFKANFRNAALREGLLPVLAFDGGYGGMVLADSGLVTLAGCVRADRLDALRRNAPGARAGDVVEAMLKRECLGVRRALADATREGAWLAAGPIDPGVRLRADDGFFRIGNAAGEAHPIVGEGMSMALQSAWLLCARLLDTRGRASIADAAWQREVGLRYAAEWRLHFGTRLKLAAAFAQVAMRSACALPLTTVVERWPGLLTRGAVWSGKTRSAVGPELIGALATQAAVSSPQAGLPNLPAAAAHRPITLA